MTDKYEKGKTRTAIALKKAIPTALILTALLALLLTIFLVGGASSEKAAPDEVVKWNGQLSDLSEKTGGGIKIPGYGAITLPAGETTAALTLCNPEENPCIFRYTLYLDGSDTPLYISPDLSPGCAVETLSLSSPLEKGDYTLRIEISSFDPSTGAALNGAVVRAPLSVL